MDVRRRAHHHDLPRHWVESLRLLVQVVRRRSGPVHRLAARFLRPRRDRRRRLVVRSLHLPQDVLESVLARVEKAVAPAFAPACVPAADLALVLACVLVVLLVSRVLVDVPAVPVDLEVLGLVDSARARVAARVAVHDQAAVPAALVALAARVLVAALVAVPTVNVAHLARSRVHVSVVNSTSCSQRTLRTRTAMRPFPKARLSSNVACRRRSLLRS